MAQSKHRYLEKVRKAPATQLLKSANTKKNLMCLCAWSIYTRRGVSQI